MRMLDIKNRLIYRYFRHFPTVFWRSYGRKARESGFSKLCLTVSFDCDTDEDIEAAASLDPWLRSIGIRSVYAVPGVQLQRGASIYREIAECGAEFINHGYLPHAEWKGDRYYSQTFYDRMTAAEVEADIRRGDEVVTAIIGSKPLGFRAPHFGHFQERSQLLMQYRILKSLDYRYSTSTVPIFSFRHGPAWSEKGIMEIPLSGSFGMPANILDSWSYLDDPRTPNVSEVYGRLLMHTVDALLSMDVVGLLNIYVDPSHVVKGRVFKEALQHVISSGVESLNYMDVLTIIESPRILGGD